MTKLKIAIIVVIAILFVFSAIVYIYYPTSTTSNYTTYSGYDMVGFDVGNDVDTIGLTAAQTKCNALPGCTGFVHAYGKYYYKNGTMDKAAPSSNTQANPTLYMKSESFWPNRKWAYPWHYRRRHYPMFAWHRYPYYPWYEYPYKYLY